MDLTLLSSVFETLQITPPSKLTLLEGSEFLQRHYPPTPPDVDTLILGIDSAEIAEQVKTVLLAAYAGSHVVWKVEPFDGTQGRSGSKKEEHLEQFGAEISSYPVSLFIPSLGEGTSFEAFAEITAHLRAPDGCPWDKEQTHQTLRKHLLEEAYETLSAMDAGDVDAMREEFGDLLLQIVLNSYIAYQDNEFSFTEVVRHIYDKIVRRHPHVFGDVKLDGVDGVLQNWEKLKEKERKELALSGVEGKKEEKGMLDGVPAALPALSQAQEYQGRAARVGFDWPEIENVLEKVREEIEEVKTAENPEQVKAELGDLFFVLVNLARWRGVDAESALREANQKFKKRFAYIEKGAKGQGRSLSDMTLEEMDSFWNEAKRAGL